MYISSNFFVEKKGLEHRKKVMFRKSTGGWKIDSQGDRN